MTRDGLRSSAAQCFPATLSALSTALRIYRLSEVEDAANAPATSDEGLNPFVGALHGRRKSSSSGAMIG